MEKEEKGEERQAEKKSVIHPPFPFSFSSLSLSISSASSSSHHHSRQSHDLVLRLTNSIFNLSLLPLLLLLLSLLRATINTSEILRTKVACGEARTELRLVELRDKEDN